MQVQRTTGLTFILPSQGASFQFGEEVSDLPEDIWYSFEYRESGGRERFGDKETRLPFVLARSVEGNSILAIDLANMEDQQVYEYDLENVIDPYPTGESLSHFMFPVFRSYADMLSQIASVKVQFGDKELVILAEG